MATQKVSHILYLSEAPGANPFSGAENHVLALLVALAQANVDVELIAMMWSGEEYTKVHAKLEELRSAGVAVVTVVRKSEAGGIAERFSLIQSWMVLWRLLRERRDRTIHIHLDLRVAPFLARLAGCRKVVVSIHNDEPVYLKPAWRHCLHLADRFIFHYIAITEHVKEYFCDAIGVKKLKVDTIYYGVEVLEAETPTRAQFGLPEDAYVVGFVGRLVNQKNLPVLLEALRQRSGMQGVIVGNGPLIDELQSFVASAGMGNVHFLGAVPDASRLMPLFDVFCLPSLWEGLGLVLVEAMMRGVPIIGSRRGAIPEVLGNGEYGRLFEPTVKGLLEALDYAVEHPGEMLQVAGTARAAARGRFSVARMVQQTISVYGSIS